ncbi:MAG: hypothetical protein HYX71_01410 [Opitutae bacterium]|nr:hypothetical protein [Opitutae bacterium]
MGKESMKRAPLILVVLFAISGCVNPLNQATYGRYTDQGNRAFAAGDFLLAEAAFARAAYNVDWGNLGDAAKASSLYNLGETKRILRKYAEAESLFLQAVVFDERARKDDAYERHMLNTALVLLYFDTHDAAKGWPYLQKTFDKADTRKYGANVRWIEVYTQYEAELSKLGMNAEASLVRDEIEKRKKTEPIQSTTDNSGASPLRV